MKNDGTTRNTYIMGKPNEILVDKNLSVGGNTELSGELKVTGMSNLTDITATDNIILSTNKAAKGVSIGTSTLPIGTGGLVVAGNTTIQKDLNVSGNTTVGGNLCIGRQCIDESNLIFLLASASNRRGFF